MSNQKLENLANMGSLQHEEPTQYEMDGLLGSGAKRLRDAQIETLSLESRFDLAYNAAHALALSALRFRGYRSNNRYIVFQALEHTLGFDSSKWRVLDKAHRKRNSSEYDGVFEVDLALVEGVIKIASEIEIAVRALGPVK